MILTDCASPDPIRFPCDEERQNGGKLQTAKMIRRTRSQSFPSRKKTNKTAPQPDRLPRLQHLFEQRLVDKLARVVLGGAGSFRLQRGEKLGDAVALGAQVVGNALDEVIVSFGRLGL